MAGTAWHCYGGEVGAQGAVHNSYPNEEAHHTECSGGEWQGTQRAAFDATMALVINAPRNWARSVVLWNMALDDANGPTNDGCLTCRGVVTVHDTPGAATYTKNLDYYALGHASRFVLPGAVRIGSTSPGAGSVQAVAYRNPDGSDVLVAHNAGAERRTFEVAWGRSSFSYALEPGAAATFMWSGRQQAPTPGFDALARSVDVTFGNPDGSSVLLSYGAAEARYQHTIASGTALPQLLAPGRRTGDARHQRDPALPRRLDGHRIVIGGWRPARQRPGRRPRDALEQRPWADERGLVQPRPRRPADL